MKVNNKVLTLLFITILFQAVGAQVLAPRQRPGITVENEIGPRLDQYLTKAAADGFSGAALVAKQGRVILDKGYGMADRERNVPVTTETLFDIGSLTKQFTAAAILKLEMQGKLRITDLIGEYFKDVPPDKTAITIHHLLTHSAGFARATEQVIGPERRINNKMHDEHGTNVNSHQDMSEIDMLAELMGLMSREDISDDKLRKILDYVE